LPALLHELTNSSVWGFFLGGLPLQIVRKQETEILC
jgi:hypothetical protein